MANFNYNSLDGFYANNQPNFPYQQPAMTPQYPTVNNQMLNNNLLLIPIQNERDLDLYPIESGRTVFFLDIKNNFLYMKTNSGGGLPIVSRKFHLEEILNNQNPTINTPVDNDDRNSSDYVSINDFNDLKNSFNELKRVCEDMKTVVDQLK